jgi:serine/threonine protein kinase
MEGTRIGSYRLTRKLGEGGMGAVYLAESDSLSTRKAVKVLLPELSADPSVMARFRNEAQAVAAIEHDNIIGIDEFSQLPNGQWFIMMPFLEGASLSAFLASHGPLTVHLALHIVAQIGAALHAAHTRGFIHRDLKPENVFITSRPTNPHLVKLLDFGIAKNTRSSPTGARTQNGAVLGTPVYMAGEQYEDAGNVDARADIFSLGVLTYVMLSGEYPFGPPTENWMALYQRQRHESPAALPWRVPSRVQNLIYSALAFNPASRPQTAQAFVLEFAQATPVDNLEPHGMEIVWRVASELLTTGPHVETTQNPNAEPSRAPWPGVGGTPIPGASVSVVPSTGVPVAVDGRGATASPATAAARAAHPSTARASISEPNAYPVMSSPPQLTTLSAASGPVAMPSPTTARRSRSAVAAAGVAAAGVITLVVVVALRGGGSQPHAATATAAPATKVAAAIIADARSSPDASPPADATSASSLCSIVVTTDPEGAELTIDGKAVGISPMTIERPPNTRISVRAELEGYRTATETVSIIDGMQRAEVRLIPKRKGGTPTNSRPQSPSDASTGRGNFNPDDVMD